MMLAEFCENSKVVSSNFSIIKNIVGPSSSSSLPKKIVFCFKSEFSNSVCLLKSIANSFQYFQK